MSGFLSLRLSSILSLAIMLGLLSIPATSQAQSCNSAERKTYSVPYLDDTDKTPLQATLSSRAKDPIGNYGYPHVWLSETSSYPRPVAKAAIFRLQQAQRWNTDLAAATQAYNPEVMFYEQLTHAEFQGYNVPGQHPHIGNGPYFERFGRASQGDFQSNWELFAGHLLYAVGTTLTDNGINTSQTRIHVASNENFRVGTQAIIRASKTNFNPATTELVDIRAKGNDGRPYIEVVRGYKPFTRWRHPATSHNRGAWVAQVIDTVKKHRWSYNFATVSPKDSNGRNAVAWISWWHKRNYNRGEKGNIVRNVRIDGHFTDVDYYDRYFKEGTRSKLDCNNDGVEDRCHSSSGQNLYGEGMMDYYQYIRTNFPDSPYVTGVFEARGFELVNGFQGEGGLAGPGQQLSANPSWSGFPGKLADFKFSSHFSQQPSAPHLLVSHPMKSWPLDGNSGSQGNEPMRLNLALSAITRGGFAIRNSHNFPGPMPDEAVVYRGQPGISPTPQWGETVNAGDGDAKNTSGSSRFDYTDTRKALGWMGKPLGPAWRIVNENDWQPQDAIVNSTFESGTSGWGVSNSSLVHETRRGAEGTNRSLRVTPMRNFEADPWKSVLNGPSVNMTRGQWYTLVFWAWADDTRRIQAGIGGNSSQKAAIFVPSTPRLYIMPFKAASTGQQRVNFYLGGEMGNIWFDQVKVFRGNADFFRRDFEYGIWVANRGSTAKTVTFAETVQKIRGRQDPGINNGARVNQDSIPPNTARFYVRLQNNVKKCNGDPDIIVNTTTTTSTTTTTTSTSTTTTSSSTSTTIATTSSTTTTTLPTLNPDPAFIRGGIIRGETQTVVPNRQKWTWFATNGAGDYVVDVRWNTSDNLDIEIVNRSNSQIVRKLSSSTSKQPREIAILSLPADTGYYVKVYNEASRSVDFTLNVYQPEAKIIKQQLADGTQATVKAKSQKWPWFRTDKAGFYLLELNWKTDDDLDFSLTANKSDTVLASSSSSSANNSREFARVYLPANTYYNVRVFNRSSRDVNFGLEVLLDRVRTSTPTTTTTSTTVTTTTSSTTTTSTTRPSNEGSLTGAEINGERQLVGSGEQNWTWFRTAQAGNYIVDVSWSSSANLNVEVAEKSNDQIVRAFAAATKSSEAGIIKLKANTDYYVKVHNVFGDDSAYNLRVYQADPAALTGSLVDGQSTTIKARTQKWPWFKTNQAGFYLIDLDWASSANLDFSLTQDKSNTVIVEAKTSGVGRSREFAKVYLKAETYYNVRVRNYSSSDVRFKLRVEQEIR